MNKWIMRLGLVLAVGALGQSDQMIAFLKGQVSTYGQPVVNMVAQASAIQNANAGQLHANWISGRVSSVSDGDTVTVDTGNARLKIRLLAIDSPEVTCHGEQSHCKEEGQAFGREAKEALSKAVYKKEIKVRLNGETTYDRKVGTIFYNDIDVNYLMVRAGYAWHYEKFARQQPGEEALQYAAAQEQARSERKGLWASSSPQPPWDWRKGRPRN